MQRRVFCIQYAIQKVHAVEAWKDINTKACTDHKYKEHVHLNNIKKTQ